MKPSLIILLVLFLCPLAIFTRSCKSGYEGAAVDGNVWMDTNRDGVKNDNEGTLTDIEVRLYNAAGELVDTTTTYDGYYSFGYDDSFSPGSYYLVFSIPEGYQVAAPAEFSQIDPVSGRSAPLDIQEASANTLNLGLIPVTPPEEQVVPEPIILFPTDDAVVTLFGPAGNFGDLDNFWLDDQSIVYLRFPIDLLPADGEIESVILNLFMDGSGKAAGEKISITYPDPASYWSELDLTWNNRPYPFPEVFSLEYPLGEYTGTGSVDTFDLTELFKDYLAHSPSAQYFDVMFNFSSTPAVGASQGWYSHESHSPPQLMIGMSYDL